MKSSCPGLNVRLNSTDRFDRIAAAQIVPQLTPAAFEMLIDGIDDSSANGKMATAIGSLNRSPTEGRIAFEVGLPIAAESSNDPAMRADAIRLMQLGVGDLTPEGQVAAVFEGYAARRPLEESQLDLAPYRAALASIFPTEQRRLDQELSRLLAVLGSGDEQLMSRVVDRIDAKSHPTDDVHYLIVAARITSKLNDRQRERVAQGLLNLDAKIAEHRLHVDRNWDVRLRELTAAFFARDPELARFMVNRPRFGRPEHVIFFDQLPKSVRDDATSAFADAAARDEDYPWNADVIRILSKSQRAQDRALIRGQFQNRALRGAVLRALADQPAVGDRGLFVQGLELAQRETMSACVKALATMPSTQDASENVALASCLRRLGTEKDELSLRDRIIQQLRRNQDQDFGFPLSKQRTRLSAEEHKRQREAVKSWTRWMVKQYPDQARQYFADDSIDLSAFRSVLAETDWSSGQTARGHKVFVARTCDQCHGGRRALGPDLAGVAQRFSREDLLTSIVDPSRDVSSRYQTELIETRDGQVISGLIIYESVDGLILRDAEQTFRVESNQIVSRTRIARSLMPANLLKGASSQDLADLFAYLQSLSR